jgi:hypothetical protein
MNRGAICAMLAVLTLSGCAGTSVTDAANALKDDKTNVCVVVHNAFPPFANDFTMIRMGDPTGTAPTCK